MKASLPLLRKSDVSPVLACFSLEGRFTWPACYRGMELGQKRPSPSSEEGEGPSRRQQRVLEEQKQEDGNEREAEQQEEEVRWLPSGLIPCEASLTHHRHSLRLVMLARSHMAAGSSQGAPSR